MIQMDIKGLLGKNKGNVKIALNLKEKKPVQ